MSLAQRIHRLVRAMPGLGAHDARERLRDLDAVLRARVAADLAAVRAGVVRVQGRLADRGDLTLLPALDRAVARLQTLEREVRFAARGWTDVFAAVAVGEAELAAVRDFDATLAAEVQLLRGCTARLDDCADRPDVLREALAGVEAALDQYERALAARAAVLRPPGGKE